MLSDLRRKLCCRFPIITIMVAPIYWMFYCFWKLFFWLSAFFSIIAFALFYFFLPSCFNKAKIKKKNDYLFNQIYTKICFFLLKNVRLTGSPQDEGVLLTFSSSAWWYYSPFTANRPFLHTFFLPRPSSSDDRLYDAFFTCISSSFSLWCTPFFFASRVIFCFFDRYHSRSWHRHRSRRGWRRRSGAVVSHRTVEISSPSFLTFFLLHGASGAWKWTRWSRGEQQLQQSDASRTVRCSETVFVWWCGGRGLSRSNDSRATGSRRGEEVGAHSRRNGKRKRRCRSAGPIHP